MAAAAGGSDSPWDGGVASPVGPTELLPAGSTGSLLVHDTATAPSSLDGGGSPPGPPGALRPRASCSCNIPRNWMGAEMRAPHRRAACGLAVTAGVHARSCEAVRQELVDAARLQPRSPFSINRQAFSLLDPICVI